MVQRLHCNDYSIISPNFIYNRADLYSNNHCLLKVQNNDKSYEVELALCDNHAELGAWMMRVPGHDLDEISKFVFSTFRNIDYISFFNIISDRIYVPCKHYHVDLPDSYDDLKKRISAKSRNTMSRKKKKAEAEFGKIEMVEYDIDGISDDIISEYFDMKEKTHHINYGLSYKDYLDKQFKEKMLELKKI